MRENSRATPPRCDRRSISSHRAGRFARRPRRRGGEGSESQKDVASFAPFPPVLQLALDFGQGFRSRGGAFWLFRIDPFHPDMGELVFGSEQTHFRFPFLIE